MFTMTLTCILLYLVAVLILSCNFALGHVETIHLSCPSIAWKQIMMDTTSANLIKTALQNDLNIIQQNLSQANSCGSIQLVNYYVNDTGFFMDAEVNCSTHIVNLIEDAALQNLNATIENLISVDGNNMTLWQDCDPRPTVKYLLPGKIDVLPQADDYAVTKVVLLSGDYADWQKLLMNSEIVNSIQRDLRGQIGPHVTRVWAIVDSMTAYPVDSSRTSSGEGRSGVSVQVTITQKKLSDDKRIYDTFTLNALLRFADMHETTATFNRLTNITTTRKIDVVAVYTKLNDDEVTCQAACIIALTIFVSMVYLMLCVLVITTVAVNCYMIQTVEQDIINVAVYISKKMRSVKQYTRSPRKNRDAHSAGYIAEKKNKE